MKSRVFNLCQIFIVVTCNLGKSFNIQTRLCSSIFDVLNESYNFYTCSNSTYGIDSSFGQSFFSCGSGRTSTHDSVFCNLWCSSLIQDVSSISNAVISENRPRKDCPLCTHCGKVGHTITKGYKLHGYPSGFSTKPVNSTESSSQGRANRVSASPA